jgi:hypothetical protein
MLLMFLSISSSFDFIVRRIYDGKVKGKAIPVTDREGP